MKKGKLDHPLPKVPNTVAKRFKSLCQVLPIDLKQQLQAELEKNVNLARERSKTNLRINKRRLEDLADRCSILLDAFQDVGEQDRALIVGALRYFVIDDDEFSDEVFFTGLDDDAKVVNHVLEQLGINGKYILLE